MTAATLTGFAYGTFYSRGIAVTPNSTLEALVPALPAVGLGVMGAYVAGAHNLEPDNGRSHPPYTPFRQRATGALIGLATASLFEGVGYVGGYKLLEMLKSYF